MRLNKVKNKQIQIENKWLSISLIQHEPGTASVRLYPNSVTNIAGNLLLGKVHIIAIHNKTANPLQTQRTSNYTF